jgi:hypothetical protein
VATDIVVRTQLTGAVPAHDEGTARNIDDHEAARLPDLVRDADWNPRAAEDPFELEGMELG